MSTKIDMHLHTKGSDGWGTPVEIAAMAALTGMDAICITDHHKTWTKEGDKVAKACEREGVTVFRGCEYSTDSGHVLIYGVDVGDLKFGFYEPVQKVIDAVLERGGVVIPSHPYKGYQRTLGDKVKALQGLRHIEVLNGQCCYQAPEANQAARKAAQAMKVYGIGGSDAHDPRGIGLAYTVFPGTIRTEGQFLRALQRSSCLPVLSRKRLGLMRGVHRENPKRPKSSTLNTPQLNVGPERYQFQPLLNLDNHSENPPPWLDESDSLFGDLDAQEKEAPQGPGDRGSHPRDPNKQ